MRILQLRFKNLNSLSGEWCIDFTHPAYVSSGIFAITGPTGSGKTTILDAICLALYGQTPRLKSISKGTNEIMTRGTGECFAEVTYESQVGQFSVHWSQWRARKKPDGELQAPKHEISDLRTKRVLETKLSKVEEKVIETTGLDYTQFTRSILLAQGDFATFLNANADDRAPILEKITGTEIYSDISRKVHERNAVEVGRLAEIRDEIENLDLLSPEEEGALRAECRETEAEIDASVKKRAEIQGAISWLKGIQQLMGEIDELERKKKVAEEKRWAASADLEHLSRARRTLPLQELYSKTVHVRDQFRTVDGEVQDMEDQLARAVPAHEAALLEHQACKFRLEVLQEEQETEKEVITLVRDLDTRIRESERQMGERREELEAILERFQETQRSLDQALLEKAGFKQEQESATSYLEEHEADSRLSTELSGLGQRLNLYSMLAEKVEERENRRREQENALKSFEQALNVQQDSLSKREGELLTAESTLQAILDEFNQVLNYRKPVFWRDCEMSLNKRRNMLESLKRVHETVGRSDRRIEALRQDRDALNKDIDLANAELATLKRERQLQEEKIALIETNLALLQHVESLEEERERLEDGVPCPLCGSPDHPYARGNIPRADPVRQDLEQSRSDLRGITERVDEKGTIISELMANIQSNEGDERHLEEEIGIMLEGADMGFDDIRAMTRTYDVVGMLEKALRSCNAYYSICHDIITYANAREPAIDKAREKVTTLKDSLPGLRSACDKGQAERDICNNTIKELSERIRENTDEIQELLPVIRSDLQSYGLDLLAPGDVVGIIPALEERKTAYETQMSRKELSTRGIEQRHIAISGYQKRIEEDKGSAATLSSAIAGKENELFELSAKRTRLYGEKDPAIEEVKMGAQVRTAEEAFRAVDINVADLKARIESITGQVSQKSFQLDEIRKKLHNLESMFASGIIEAGFDSEADFIAARLPHDRFVFLEKVERDLHTEETKIQSSLDEKQQLLEQERARAVTDKSLDTLEAEDCECGETITNLNRTHGSIGERLKRQAELIAARGGLVSALTKQEAESARWQRLHDLIGSADGKKFRVFAQGLTFDRLIAHANRHLRKMSDRYLLIRRPDFALELDIMDHYQAGELRTTKNLSGGESFIVSLALALGLSGMAGRNVRIDSLFLDEGFGTLDDETLETALETLSNLRQEGKVIGIISHVPALKERISTQIVVEKKSGGRSRLLAPGCRLLQP